MQLINSNSTSDSAAPARRFDAALFDFDGTLADTLPLIAAAWNHALRPIFNREFSLQEVVARFGPTDAAMIAREMHGHDPSAIERAVEEYFGHYESAHDLARDFEGINDLLGHLKSDGLKLGLMTGKGRRAADITLRALGWQSAFAFVVTGDDISQPKPSPEGILRVARELQADPARCAYVGDLPVDIQAGRAAGMATIAAGWAAFDEAALRDAQPDFWAASPGEARAIFNSEE